MIITSFNNLPYELLVSVFQFLEPEDLMKCRLTNHHLSEIADNENAYSNQDAYKAKVAFENYVHIDQSILNINLTINKLAAKVDKIILNCNQTKKELVLRQGEWFGYIVSKINYRVGIFASITNLAKYFFSSIKNEIAEQNDLEDSIELLKSNHVDLTKYLQQIKKETKSQIASDKDNLISKYRINKEMGVADFKMMSLFGGKKQFMALPILDLSLCEFRDYIDNIHPDDMSAPIMRCVDKTNRKIFAISASGVFVNIGKKVAERKKICQTFYQKYTTEATWTSAGSILIEKGPQVHIINRGHVDDTAFNQLKLFIDTGKHLLYGNKELTLE